jgi:hypothetical protein
MRVELTTKTLLFPTSLEPTPEFPMQFLIKAL